MNLQELVDEVRRSIDDVDTEIWTNADLVDYANWSIEKFAKETLALVDTSELSSGAIVVVTNPTAPITSITVNGVNVLTANVTIGATINATATNINGAVNSALYTATVKDNVVTLTALSGTGTTPNGFAVAGSQTPASSLSFANFVGGSSVAPVKVLPGVHTYAIDSRILHIKRAKLDGMTISLASRAAEWMDAFSLNWEKQTGEPKVFIFNQIANTLRLYPVPIAADTLRLRTARLPITKFTTTSMNTQTVDMPRIYDQALILGMQSRAYGKVHLGRHIDEMKSRSKLEQFMGEIEMVKRTIARQGRGGDSYVSEVTSGYSSSGTYSTQQTWGW